ncbi:MAG: hypothetical protein RLZZ546_1195 [Bacteroidota bacterium]|jgi:hypothetical protein
MVKNKTITIPLQAKLLREAFPNATVNTRFERNLTFIDWLPSSPLGNRYRVRINAIFRNKIEVFVINPRPLALALGQYKLPHVYCNKTQELCLYYPKFKEWDFSKIILNTIIPWTMEWLFFYEIWLSTGQWYGKGIEH